MRIVNFKTFISLPSETVFSNYEPCVFEGLYIKGDSIGEFDFFYQQIIDSIDCDGSEDFINKLENSKDNGVELEMDFDIQSRDGLFEYDRLFAVWSNEDVEKLITRLRDAIWSEK